MNKLMLIFILMLSLVSNVYAGGGVMHMFIAQETIAKIPDPQLRNLLLNNFDAYLVGAVYPDSGYIKKTGYGEDSHWEPFLFAFTDYLKDQYQDPVDQNPRLVAFLMGCAAHSKSDIVSHWTFYNYMAEYDFNGNWNKERVNDKLED